MQGPDQSTQSAPPPLTEAQRSQGRIFLGWAVAAVGFALALQIGLNSNFMAQELGIDGREMGISEAVREFCGISALGLLALMAGMAEPLVGAAMLALFAVGIGAYAFVPTFAWVVAFSLVWSQGLHVWMPLPHSMVMGLAEPGRAGHRLGRNQAAGSAGFAAGLVAAWLLSLYVEIRPLYLLAGVAGLGGAAACLKIPRALATERPRLVFRRKYRLFYLLSFLEGWRKQIFICFAGFLLVKVHDVPVTTMLGLFLVVHAFGLFLSPAVGRLVDRVGERAVLVAYFAALTPCFLGYAFIGNLLALKILFVVDNALFVFAMAINTLANRLAPHNERTATLSMGVAMNHIAAVTTPLLGGALWETLGPKWTFIMGAAAAALSIPAAACVPARSPATPLSEEPYGA